ncbi:phage tail assembly protein T [Klebsiella michiganensis]|uniref:phage tail assembly protein T n=2 Tax=Klebsiella michiganensis TaxID=1134687 RepID=UPI0015F516FB|nr:phage tail assembly protein T [Klebsiella michiganensis]MCZ0063343.1 phage tail assembly protein T [Klebsiella michiganensis]MCZ0079344.1 phage tail assembly protein T [Klebsiella michiganensis]WAX83056.1 phage tail assembly protein T [Klebsiella michiganensis]HBM3233447.1 phage tail assembly protein T [Klebsiella michiganensis]
MRLAREFGRPDWRAMLSEMSSSEWFEWIEYYQDNCFSYDLLDSHFANLSYLAVSLFTDPDKHGISALDFSLLATGRAESDELSDEQLMSIAESIPGGTRYVPASG